jgi:hypothetical protein
MEPQNPYVKIDARLSACTSTIRKGVDLKNPQSPTEQEIQAEVAKLRTGFNARFERYVTPWLIRLFLPIVLTVAGWKLAGWVHRYDIFDKPISTLTLREVGNNVLAGLVFLVSLALAFRAFTAEWNTLDSTLHQQAKSNVAVRKRAAARYEKSKIWGFISDPDAGDRIAVVFWRLVGVIVAILVVFAVVVGLTRHTG